MWIVHFGLLYCRVIIKLISSGFLENYFSKRFFFLFLVFFFFFNIVIGCIFVSEEFLVGCSLVLFFFTIVSFVSNFISVQVEFYSKNLKLRFNDLAKLNLLKLEALKEYYVVDLCNWSVMFELFRDRVDLQLEVISKKLVVGSYTEIIKLTGRLLEKLIHFFFNFILLPALRFKIFLFSYNCKLAVHFYSSRLAGRKFDFEELLQRHLSSVKKLSN